jgi:hypothetical protein
MVDSTILMKAVLVIIYYIHFGFPLRNPCMWVIISRHKFLFVFKFGLDVFSNRVASFFPAFPDLTPVLFYCLTTFITLLQQGEMWTSALEKQINK